MYIGIFPFAYFQILTRAGLIVEKHELPHLVIYITISSRCLFLIFINRLASVSFSNIQQNIDKSLAW